MIILAFETSCDETSVAVLNDEEILSNIIFSQYSHIKFGGVVPEIASREHLKYIVTLTEDALKKAGKKIQEIELVSATYQPGLIGALLIGLNFAKATAMTLNSYFVPVNHIQAHLYSSFIGSKRPVFPFLSLIISGGHTLLVLVKDYFKHKIIGHTVDDAAGEAFDKVAKMLRLGYPGGPVIDRISQSGDKHFCRFPIASVRNKPFHFSFSGIKTSVLYYMRENKIDIKKDRQTVIDIAASFQYTMVETLFRKTFKAADEFGIKNICLSGGVSANSALKEKFNSLVQKGYRIYIPDKEYTTDNAAMIGITALYRFRSTKDKQYYRNESFSINAKPKLDYENF